ncbi:hypothetical protein MTYP_00163 [Methylophilaceae bacterium]|nr:hypothetical protein MTYP_00163 [Methylophilaceae bacterium]
MAEPREARFQWGQPVKTTMNLVNDGSYPDVPADAILAEQGEHGEVVNVGLVEETGEPIYLVEFADGKVVGVLEEEIEPC